MLRWIIRAPTSGVAHRERVGQVERQVDTAGERDVLELVGLPDALRAQPAVAARDEQRGRDEPVTASPAAVVLGLGLALERPPSGLVCLIPLHGREQVGLEVVVRRLPAELLAQLPLSIA